MTSLTASEELMHTTVRIECELADGRESTGTGFFFRFELDDKQGIPQSIPIIVTNRHVIKDAKISKFVVTKQNSDGSPRIGDLATVVIDEGESRWIKHPDPSVDLAVLPMQPLLQSAESQNVPVFHYNFTDSDIPTATELESLRGIEDITMIGYPDGIWDSKNNMPITRRGITATNPKIDYNGSPVFVIDCACFPGSSGSPVLIFNQDGYSDARGNFIGGGVRVILMGILYAGPQSLVEGEICTIDRSLRRVPVSLSTIPNNLGYVVKSDKLRDFKRLLENHG